MKVPSIDFKAIPHTVKNGVDKVGSTSIKFAKSANETIGKHTPQKIKDIKCPKFISNAAKWVKEKTPQGIKDGLNRAAEFTKAHKETVAGSAVILAAVICAAKIIKGVSNKIKETRISAHQG